MLQSLWVHQIQEELRGIAAIGSESTQEAADLLIRLSAPMLRTSFVDAVSQLVQEINDTTIQGVRLTIQGDEILLEATQEDSTVQPPSADRNARIALRLPQDLKDSVERTASLTGVSTNSWIVNVLHAAVTSPTPNPRPGNRLRGSGRA